MSLTFKIVCTLGLIGALSLLMGLTFSSGSEAREAKSPTDVVERGRYLVASFGCADCHTPLRMGEQGPEPDLNHWLGGHPQQLELPPAPRLPEGPWTTVVSASMTAWSGPWGVSYTANLTPDDETGLGRWTEKEFIDTMRTGRHLGRGREILPPMPIPAIKNMNDEDLAAIFAYLRSLPKIVNRVPNPLPPSTTR